MKQVKKLGVLIIGIVILVCLILVIPEPSYKSEKTSYCHIDSVYTRVKYEVIPEQETRYHTDCDYTITSNHKYVIGDSVEIKIIIIEKK